MNSTIKKSIIAAFCIFSASNISAQTEKIKFGDFNQWVTRTISESSILGGNTKTLYEVGPTTTITGNKAYVNMGGSPWGTSNVYAKVKGIVKGSNAVFPAVRSGSNKCVKMCSMIDNVKALGIINMDVMVAGSLYLGQMMEPVTSTSNPYAKMNMGMPYTKKPKALVFDYKVDMPATNSRTKSSGFGSKKTLSGRDKAVVFLFLQKRWEDEKGNIHALRVGTAGKQFANGSQWVNGFHLPIVYGDISTKAGYGWVGLRNGTNSYYAKNSKGKLVPVKEEGFDANATPTHVILMMSAGSGEPYVGTEGLTFYVDNVGFQL